MKDDTLDYFNNHPEAKDMVMKAAYAFHAPHFRCTDLLVHNFTSSLRNSKCVWCDRSREDVRYDELPPQCLKRPLLFNSIEDVILKEEELFGISRKRGIEFIPKFIKKNGLTPENLSILHHTHGFDPETVCDIMDDVEIDSKIKQMMPEYEKFMEDERILSRSKQNREIISVKSI